VVAGIIYARGVTVHQGARSPFIAGRRPFTTWRSPQRAGGIVLVWEALANLPSPSLLERYERDEMYRLHVEGRSVADTFSDAEAFFTQIKAID
jgi:hypothetical protein